MNREDILEKYRSEKSDEGLENSENTGRIYGMSVFYWVALILLFICLFGGKPTDLLWIFIVTSFAVENFAKYKFTKAQKYLWWTLGWGVWAVSCIIIYVGRAIG